MTWDGKENRKVNSDYLERDRLLTEIHADLKHFMRRFDDHVIENHQEHEKVVKRIVTLERIAWMAGGVIVVVQFVMKLL